MRRPVTTLALLAACASLVFAGALASGARGARDVHAASHDAATGAPTTDERAWRMTLSPAPDDLALAQVSFHVSRYHSVSPRSLRVTVLAPFGDDYMAAALPRSGTPGVVRVLVLLVNRPSPLLDPATVHVRVAAPRALGVPLVRRRTDPFTRPSAQAETILCDLTAGGVSLPTSRLGALGSRGRPLDGYSAMSAVAQAYDAVCGLPYESAFGQAVTGSAGVVCPGDDVPQGSTCCPVGITCPITPIPEPPQPPHEVPGEPPHCAPCEPTPGYACPLTATPDVCVGPVSPTPRTVSASAH